MEFQLSSAVPFVKCIATCDLSFHTLESILFQIVSCVDVTVNVQLYPYIKIIFPPKKS